MLAVSKELVFRFVSFYDASEFAEALSILASGDIEWTQLVTGKVGFDDVPAAFERLSTSDKHAKILIAPECDVNVLTEGQIDFYKKQR